MIDPGILHTPLLFIPQAYYVYYARYITLPCSVICQNFLILCRTVTKLPNKYENKQTIVEHSREWVEEASYEMKMNNLIDYTFVFSFQIKWVSFTLSKETLSVEKKGGNLAIQRLTLTVAASYY